jgi:hypothetical protein
VPALPSAGLRRWRRTRILATVAVRDEMRFLPGTIENLAAQFDGIVALDDGSTDGSAEFLAAHPAVIELVRVPAGRPNWDEPGNHRRVIEAAVRHGAEWIYAADADERVERDFRVRAERVIARGRPLGLTAYGVRFREMWTPKAYRCDGIWGRKAAARLFQVRPGMVLDDRALHVHKAPLDGMKPWLGYPIAALELYHLRMIDPANRAARRARYERLDPDRRWQPIGYAYLTDERGLRLRRISAARGYEPAYGSRSPTLRAGAPAQISHGPVDSVSTDPAPTTVPSATTSGRSPRASSVAPEQRITSSPMLKPPNGRG